jgi:diguanylate cyclase (GGDEF)-like protein
LAVSEIYVYKTDSDGNLVCALDSNNSDVRNDSDTSYVHGNFKKAVNEIYIKNYASSGQFFFTEDGYRYMNFYPVNGGTSNVSGVIGIAINAQHVHTVRIVLNVLAAIIILLGCIISIRFSNKIFKKISNPLYLDASNTDALTGLKNKNSFSVDMHNIEEGSTERYSVVTADLNGLKNINDTRGHQAGDLYIQKAAQILKKATAGTDFIPYRIGGDEFSIIVKDRSVSDLQALVDKIEFLITEGNKSFGMPLTMAIGYAKFDKELDRNFSMTIERSDAMMYENKRLFYKKKNMQPR